MMRITEILEEIIRTPPDALWLALHGLAAVVLTAVIVLTLRRRRQRRAAAARTDALRAHPGVSTLSSRGHWGSRMLRRAHFGDGDDAPDTHDLPAGVVGGGRDPGWRIQAVAAHNYRTRPVISRTQARLLPLLERIVYTRGHGHRLLTPTALAQLLEPVATPSATPDRLRRAGLALDGVSVALPLVDAEGHMIAAIEVRGPRAIDPECAEGEQIKRAVLRRVGVPLIEVGPHDAEDALRAAIEPLLTGTPPAAAG